MQANPYSSQQSSGDGSGRQWPKAAKPWKGKLQGPVGNYYRLVIDGVVYVGLAVEAVESTGGEYYRLQFLGNQMRNILRSRLTITQGEAMTAPPPYQAIPNALQDTDPPEQADYPGTSGYSGGRPHLNQ